MTRSRQRGTLVLAIVFALAGCGPDRITAPAVSDAVAAVFGRLALLQQQIVGRGNAAPVDVRAACGRGAPSAGGAGAGDDWACELSWTPAGSARMQSRYDVRLRPDGCFTAEGPPSAVGATVLLSRDGQMVVNPLTAFDGCLDVA